MCDYSLHHVDSVPAKAGDKLVSTSFPMSSTRGFSAEGQPNVAVCLLPGTEVAFEKEVACETVAAPEGIIQAQVARFRQINLDHPYAHHDALEFPDGRVVLVTHLVPGQKATVLQLPASPAREHAEPGHVEPQPAAESTAAPAEAQRAPASVEG